MSVRYDGAMRQAMAFGASALGRTSPNPPVGAIVLDADGQLVGFGGTAPPGGPHAEIAALEKAGERARGGTLVVTLEPCRHTGRTPPCTDAVLRAGIRRVVYAVDDPTEHASGGAVLLRAAGIDVHGGVLADEVARGALEPWLHAVRTGRPFVTWKYAATLDGRVAAIDGTSRWITCAEARRDVHRLRGECDAILVGSGTVLADDPHLTVRDGEGKLAARQPLRVVSDRSGRTPSDARIRDSAAETLITSADPVPMLTALYERGVRSVLLEGGPTLAGAYVAADLVDRIVGYLAPRLLGSGPSALGDAGIPTLATAPRLRIDDVAPIGDDIRIIARRETSCSQA